MADSIVSLRKLVNYTERVFALTERLEQVAEQSDGRRQPVIAMPVVLTSWLLGLWKGIESTDSLERAVVKDPVFRRYGGWPDGVIGSAKTLGRVLEEVSLEAIEALAHALFFQACRSKMVEKATVAGLRLAAIDASELICSEKIHCEQCQTRTKRVKREGELVKVTEYYHQVVVLQWVGGQVPWLLGVELIQPGEGESTAALRMLDRVLPRLKQSVDGIIGDGLYDCRPFWQTLAKHRVKGIAILSREESLLWQDLELLVNEMPPVEPPGLKLRMWEMDSEAWQPEVKEPLRLLFFERTDSAPAWKHQRKQLAVATTLSRQEASRVQVWKGGLARWGIENGGFLEYTRELFWNHNFHHHAQAIGVLVVLRALVWCLQGCYVAWACRAVVGPWPLRVELQEQLRDSFVIERLVLTGKLRPD